MGASGQLAGTAVLLGAVACAQVIGLGDEATLAEETASGGGGGSAGSGATGGTTHPCGIPPAASQTCNSCWETNCCPEALACATEPACLAANEALEDCLYDVACILQVTADNQTTPAFPEFSECIAACGTQCMPSGSCLALAECCQEISEQFLRDACLGIIAAEDQVACQTRLDNEFSLYCQ